MTTPTMGEPDRTAGSPTADIRAESVALLAAAMEATTDLDPTTPVAGWYTEAGAVHLNWNDAIGAASCILAASPVLARRLALATAWEMAEAALPEGWFCVVQRVWSGTWEAYAMPATHSPRQSSKGDTPTAALVALMEKLEQVKRGTM